MNLEPGTSYAVKIGKGLKDSFGQALSTEYAFHFTAGDAKPRLSMQGGTSVVEAQSGRYPLWTRNLTKLDVDIAWRRQAPSAGPCSRASNGRATELAAESGYEGRFVSLLEALLQEQTSAHLRVMLGTTLTQRRSIVTVVA